MISIILSAKIRYLAMSDFFFSPEGVIPIRGKKSITLSLECLNKNTKKVYVAVASENQKLQDILTKNSSEVTQVLISPEDNTGILNSLNSVLKLCPDKTSVEILLGDTYFITDDTNEIDVLYTSSEIKTSNQWCVVSKAKDSFLDNIYNKIPDIDLRDKEALIGYYRFSDIDLLKKITSEQLEYGNSELSFIIQEYNKIIPIKLNSVSQWFDFGHMHGIVKARTSLYNSRNFNNLKVDIVTGIITKSSSDKGKLLNEANWYKSLPEPVLVYAPKIISIKEDKDTLSLALELYGYPNLAELYVYSNSSLEDWCNIIDVVFQVHAQLAGFLVDFNKEDLQQIYVVKTRQRVDRIKSDNEQIYKLFSSKTLIINNVEYNNFDQLEGLIQDKIKGLLDIETFSIVHGDFCFSNILFDPMHYIVRLIDPRGGFGSQSIYGDPRYDVAKLRHSVVGLYDFVQSDLFELDELGNESFNFKISQPQYYEKLSSYFDQKVVEEGYKLSEIKLIEALLFLTMIPLHSDNIKRQKAFYLMAILKLNDVLYE
ncbi:MAG: aminoglycoside phosphotransferase family protein [Rickettsiaceae bacterium]|nr:aminoglycoside phosphotransferase family protein [Rickettsiaceae bacterium]